MLPGAELARTLFKATTERRVGSDELDLTERILQRTSAVYKDRFKENVLTNKFEKKMMRLIVFFLWRDHLFVKEMINDRQTHTHHLVLTQNAPQKTPQLPCRLPPFQLENLQQQRMIRGFSRDTTLPKLNETHNRTSTDHIISINRLAGATAGSASQQRSTASTMLKPVSTNKRFFHGKKEKFEFFEHLCQKMLKMQFEMTEAMKIKLFHAHLRKEALQTIRNTKATRTQFSENSAW